MTLENNDPNIRWRKTKLRLTFMLWDYSKTFEAEANGHAYGLSAIDLAIGNIYDEVLEWHDYGDVEVPRIVLVRADGDELLVEDDEDDGEDFLKKMLVKAEILSIEEFKE
jgi:hypothetical protein